MLRLPLRLAAACLLATAGMLGTGLGLVACRGGSPAASGVTETEAKQFVERADAELLEQSKRLSQAQWVSSNFITSDTETISANTYQAFIAATMRLSKDATRFDGLDLDADTKRRLDLLKLATIPLPAPSDAA